MEVPEQAVLGNNRMLVTIGKHGELRYLFWPTIDYPQHVRGSLLGIFYSFKGENRFDWLTDTAWTKKQEYLPDANIVRTVFRHQNPDLNITLADVVLPDSDALIRQFVIQNVSDNEIFLRLFYFIDLALSDSPIDDETFLQSIPELIARKKGVEITHEAAVGKISEREITYLMTRKLTRDQAVSLIIRGFMDVGILGLPEALNAEIKRLVEASAEAE